MRTTGGAILFPTWLALALVVLLVGAPSTARAQHEYDIWCFGRGFTLDFRTKPATLSRSASIDQFEGCASICSRTTGALLFYTDGITVWDATGGRMPNGSGLYGHFSSTQSALIVPMPCDTNRYYIFTSGHQGYDSTVPPRGINYSIVDMRLNGGRGDVEASGKNTPLQPQASEHLVAIADSNGFDYWVVTHSRGGRTFSAWRVTSTGVSPTPVTSTIGIDHGRVPGPGDNALGYLKASPNGRHLAMTVYSREQAELFDFDPGSGRITNTITLSDSTDTLGEIYGITFSPDNSRLYHAGNFELYQYDLTAYTSAAILASRRVITANDRHIGVNAGMQIGPDGRIYVVTGAGYIGVINRPNVQGNACDFREVEYSTGILNPWRGFPNNIDAIWTLDSSSSSLITPGNRVSLCEGDSLRLTADNGFAAYEWSTGDTTRAITVDTAGEYTCRVYNQFGCFREDVVAVVAVRRPTPRISPIGTYPVCEGQTLRLRVNSGYMSVLWSTGETGDTVSVTRPGRYYLSVIDTNGCAGRDSIDIVFHPLPRPIISGADVGCFGDTVTLDAGAGYSSYLWSTGDTTRTILVTATATFAVAVRDGFGCAGSSSSMNVIIKDRIVPLLTPGDTVELCEGDTAIVSATSGYERYTWSTGDTGRIARVFASGAYSVVVEDSDGCRGASGKVEVIVHPRPARPTIAHRGDSLFSPPYPLMQWSYNGAVIPGATTDRIKALAPGLYAVTVTDSNSCGASSTPYRIVIAHSVRLDTVVTRVGLRRLLRMRIEPPIEQHEMLSACRIAFSMSATSLYLHGVLDAHGVRLSARPGATSGEYVVDRQGDVLEGDELLRIEFEGLSTGIPDNIVPIIEVTFPENDRVAAGGDGRVILAGCDIDRAFGWGRSVSIHSVTPNPTASTALVEYHAPSGRSPLLLLIDPLGREWGRWGLDSDGNEDRSTTIDLVSVPSGFYRLQIRDGVEAMSVPVGVVR